MDYKKISLQCQSEVEKELGHKITITRYSSSPWSGQANLWRYIIIQGQKTKVTLYSMRVPEPKSAISLATYLHELGHHTLLSRNQKKSCLREFYAEQYSLDNLKRFGVKKNRKMVRHSNWYMSYSLGQALNRKMKDIPTEMMKYKKYLKSRTTKFGKRYFAI